MTIESWPVDPLQRRVWIEELPEKESAIRHFVGDLPRGRRVQVRVGDQLLADVVADESGAIEFSCTCAGMRRFELVPQ